MGDSHAGAGEGTARILTEYVAKMRAAVAAAGVFEADGVRITDVMDLAGYIINKVTGAYGGEKGRIPGYGHRHYGIYGRDPRAVALLSIAESLGLAGEYCHLAREIESILKKKKALGLCFNVDGVIGALIVRLEAASRDGQGFLHHPAHGRHSRPVVGARLRLVLPAVERFGDLHRPGSPQHGAVTKGSPR